MSPLEELFAADLGHLGGQPPQLLGAVCDALQTHGEAMRWRTALGNLTAPAGGYGLDGPAVRVDAWHPDPIPHLEALRPWRKGPFELFGVHIDAEWRSDLKFDRLARHIDVRGRRVIDIGCGNFYYGWRLLGAGAQEVVGIDPSILCAMQFQLVRGMLPELPARFVPLPSQRLLPNQGFDLVLSMGVLYHRRSPALHVEELAAWCAPGGRLALETLIVDGGDGLLQPPGRYARMRNVWCIPGIARLERWLREAGFIGVELADLSTTSVAEQRSTHWMPYQSLAEALDPADPGRTIEGHPSPRRALMLATRR